MLWLKDTALVNALIVIGGVAISVLTISWGTETLLEIILEIMDTSDLYIDRHVSYVCLDLLL